MPARRATKRALLVVALLIPVGLLVSPYLLYRGSEIMVVTSDSMAPALQTYDLIAVHTTSITDIHVGDIIVFNVDFDGVSRVVHRAVQIFDDNGKLGITTKGDNSNSTDPWVVHEEDIVGKVVGKTPFVGIFLLDPMRYALAVLIVVAAASIALQKSGSAKVPGSSEVMTT